ncbi:MAG TPA: hypothetical protein VGB07_15545 [Blastocatellia bacterium]
MLGIIKASSARIIVRASGRFKHSIEAFNLPNQTVFVHPNTSFGNANYGKITATAGIHTPRQIQFALKLSF